MHHSGFPMQGPSAYNNMPYPNGSMMGGGPGMMHPHSQGNLMKLGRYLKDQGAANSLIRQSQQSHGFMGRANQGGASAQGPFMGGRTQGMQMQANESFTGTMQQQPTLK